MSEWISVEDRLPPKYVSVLCYIPSLAPQMKWVQRVHECYIGPDGGWHSATAPAYRVEVTHWMPLPLPPMEK